jgi:hypothetical protein
MLDTTTTFAQKRNTNYIPLVKSRSREGDQGEEGTFLVK